MFKIWDFIFFKVLEHQTKNSTYWTLECSDWVNVLAVTENGHFVVTKQFRYGPNAYTLELPGGIIDKTREAIDVAKEELLEETGYGGGTWHYIGKYSPNPGLQNNHVHAFYCHGARFISPPTEIDTGVELLSHEEFNSFLHSTTEAQAFALATYYLAKNKKLF